MLKFKVKALVSKALVKESKADEKVERIKSEIEEVEENIKKVDGLIAYIDGEIDKAEENINKADEIVEFINSEIERVVERYVNNHESYMKVWRKKAVTIERSRDEWMFNMEARIATRADIKYGSFEVKKAIREKGLAPSDIDYIIKILPKRIAEAEMTIEKRRVTIDELTTEEIAVAKAYREIVKYFLIKEIKSNELYGFYEEIHEASILYYAEKEFHKYVEEVATRLYGSDKKEWVNEIIEEIKKQR